DPAFLKWLEKIEALPAGAQVAEVERELKERNSGFHGSLQSQIEEGAVTVITVVPDGLTDIAPLRAFKGLRILNCRATVPQKCRLADISPLAGLPLTQIDLTWTKVVDLSPLAGMPLTDLNLGGTLVADLAPLRGMPLASLNLTHAPVSDLSPLKGMPL